MIGRELNVEVSVDSMFDVQVKRIHEYKRQLLNVLQTIALYNDMRDSQTVNWVPRDQDLRRQGGPGYHMAKLTLKLINDVAKVVNQDPSVRGLLKIALLPNYSVTLAEIIMPAADLSEQISTAGMEASGTGNMKLALNGALTIGTLDGANVEIRDAVGPENIFIFGLTAEEAGVLRHGDAYNPRDVIAANPPLKRALDMIASGVFSPDDPHRYRPLIQALTDGGDPFLVTADFQAYREAHEAVADLYRNQDQWTRKAVINTASMGWFSSDRTIAEYAKEIWNAEPVLPVD